MLRAENTPAAPLAAAGVEPLPEPLRRAGLVAEVDDVTRRIRAVGLKEVPAALAPPLPTPPL